VRARAPWTHCARDRRDAALRLHGRAGRARRALRTARHRSKVAGGAALDAASCRRSGSPLSVPGLRPATDLVRRAPCRSLDEGRTDGGSQPRPSLPPAPSADPSRPIQCRDGRCAAGLLASRRGRARGRGSGATMRCYVVSERRERRRTTSRDQADELPVMNDLIEAGNVKARDRRHVPAERRGGRDARARHGTRAQQGRHRRCDRRSAVRTALQFSGSCRH
jgi:hypothetical protein